MATKYKLVYFVPLSALDAVKKAVFATGAGRYPGPGNYTEVAWQTLGTGQFRPGDTAKPNIGEVGKLEKVEEARVETLCVGEDITKKAVAALKEYVSVPLPLKTMSADASYVRTHPYEEPGYEVYKIEDF
ncbi:uncharacterized protein N0V89_006920 [Didymosphaeria variabile]|uniref:ATP phosphoribosyltransferase n=1 Tax=Didymosphaeria variabile TaxID=1932322 RepID=A0A9W8XIJ6_9PLEO|nr:uncharacterized protein N0V89_006920 [Didymosphaeria variabile]KAJ4351577.1 hypothetical protein N0V89_006920 [Didymosphaeria variabile]